MSILRAAAIVFALAFLAACTDEPGAEMALRASGYSGVKMTGYAWFDCDKNDTYRTGFVATGPTGLRVTGAVCSGVLKGYTIRITGAASKEPAQ